MRTLGAVLCLTLVTACHRAVEVTGLYVNRADSARAPIAGRFFPCDHPGTVWLIQDSALATRYQRIASHPGQALVAHLVGVPTDSGSIYYGRHYFEVRRILDLRIRAPGECPGVADPVLPPLRDSSGQPNDARFCCG
jgi:hypothetical protein